MIMNAGKISEARLYTRVNARMPVSIYYNSVAVACRNTRDVCVGGIFIDVRDLGLQVNSLIKVRFIVSENHVLYNVYIPALVKRIEEHGMAVTFEVMEKGIEELIRVYSNNHI